MTTSIQMETVDAGCSVSASRIALWGEMLVAEDSSDRHVVGFGQVERIGNAEVRCLYTSAPVHEERTTWIKLARADGGCDIALSVETSDRERYAEDGDTKWRFLGCDQIARIEDSEVTCLCGDPLLMSPRSENKN
ncbi:MAG: hypothetical protein QM723_17600 [Myxococcaceae bacterium]